MRTPTKPTHTLRQGDAHAREAVVLPWGKLLGRVVSEQSASVVTSAARKRLKSQAAVDHPEGKAKARLLYFAEQRGLLEVATASVKKTGKIKSQRTNKKGRAKLAQAAARTESIASFKLQVAAAVPTWRELGPTLVPHGQTYGKGAGASPSVSGRCCGIVVDRNDSRHLVVCSSGGGLWGSFDAGATWTPLTDRQPTLVMGAIAQSPSSPAIMYGATGDGDGGIPYGIGLLRSSDSGATWSAKPVNALSGVGSYDLAIDPNDPLRVWIATDQGLFLSTNGGDTVSTSMKGTCWSVSVHPSQSTEVIAACSPGIVRSSDGGVTWSNVALPGTDVNTRFSRLEVCHAPSNGAVAYVAGCDENKRAMLWRRASLGGAFTALEAPSSIDTGQAWYDWCLSVAFDDPDLVFWGAIDLFRGRRSAAGMSWQNVSSKVKGDSIHPDQHFVTFDPSAPGVVYACNDGGLFRSSDIGEHWVSLNPGLGITEFEFLAQLESNASWLMGGTQDNGSLALVSQRHWDQIALGDGGDCAAIDRGNASICYHSYYDMPIERAKALGNQAFAWTDVTPPVPDGYQSLFYPPLEARGTMLVKAGVSVWISSDDGNSWDEVALPTSTDLVTSLAIVGDHTVIVGTYAGQIWRIARGTKTWKMASVTKLATLPNGYVSDIEVVGSAGTSIWASCSKVFGAHIFRSQDGGKTFSNCNSNLPDIAVNALVVDTKNTDTVYLATDRGVYRSVDAGDSWSDFSNGLPHVIVGELILHSGSRLLRAGTRSRGAWELNL